ncbi:MAG TPA: VWA domain-containing protein [Chloroflexia bacterium]|nr:VWA domain-containing protein [Chloroflexia bacterium]
MPFTVSFGTQEALWLLLLLPLIILIAFLGDSGKGLRRGVRLFPLTLRLLITLSLILALANTCLNIPTADQSAVFLLDASASVGKHGFNQGLDFTSQALNAMRDNQQAGVVVFGQDALLAKPLNSDKQLDSVSSLKPDGSYTNIAEAVRLGSALLPHDHRGRLVLVSDGNQNAGEVREAAQVAAANGIPIDVVPLKTEADPEVSVSNVQLPATLRDKEEFELKVAVISNYAGKGRLQILENDKVVRDEPVDLQVGTNFFSEELVADGQNVVNYSARIIAGRDTVAENNQFSAATFIKAEPKVLIVEGHPEQNEAANLQAALEKSGIVTTVIAPENFPEASELNQYDSLMLVNVPATSLKASDMTTIQSYVKEAGKGMVMVGGEESYGLGGYFRTPVEDMLPLQLRLPSKLEYPSVAMVLVIDRSGSMEEAYREADGSYTTRSKLEMAKDAAYLAVTQLSSTDQVGVVTFDTEPDWQVILGPVGDPTKLKYPISRIRSGGGTSIYSGLAPAIAALKRANARSKHIIILTDGQDTDRYDYQSLVDEANQSQITISTVGLGSEVNTAFLSYLAASGGGRYSYVSNSDDLPKIFTKEARLANRSYIVEEPFTPAIADPSPILKHIEATPPLLGYVATLPRPNATLALVTGRKEPLLAYWQYGLGRVAAWTSDAKGRWATNWLSWSDFPRFWSQLVRWTIPENNTDGLQIQTRVGEDGIYLTADALSQDGHYLNGLIVNAQISGGAAKQGAPDVKLNQTAPGHYEGFYSTRNPGAYTVDVFARGNTGSAATGDVAANTNLKQTVGAVVSYSPEYKQLGVNELLLKDIASMTGGRVLSSPLQVFSDYQKQGQVTITLWPWLLLLAVLLLPLDIAARLWRMSPLAHLKKRRRRKGYPPGPPKKAPRLSRSRTG